jgi:hypothetical protein
VVRRHGQKIACQQAPTAAIRPEDHGADFGYRLSSPPERTWHGSPEP